MKKTSVLYIVILLSVVCVSCGKTGSSQKELKLTICTEEELKLSVESMISYFKNQNPGIKAEVNYLPQNIEERRYEISRLKTEIMAGKGPDVFLLSSLPINAVDRREDLFTNLDKSIGNGVFAALDKFIDEDSKIKIEEFHPAIWEAGQHNARQYVMPITCDTWWLVQKEGISEYTVIEDGDTLSTVVEKFEQSENESAKNALASVLAQFQGNWFVSSIDYEKGKATISKEEWISAAREYIGFRDAHSLMPESEDRDSFFGGNSSNMFMRTADEMGDETYTFAILPDAKGEKAARIHTFGAIGSNSEQKEAAYEFLRLFVSDEIQSGQGFQVGDKHYRAEILIEPLALPVRSASMTKWLESAWDLSAKSERSNRIMKAYSGIDTAFFVSEEELKSYELGNAQGTIEEKAEEMMKLYDTVAKE